MFDEDSKYNKGRKLAFQQLGDHEVHSDRIARHTGSLFLELACRGKESGVSVTKASRWALELADGIWVSIPTARLKAIAEAQKAARGTILGGDGNASEGVLIPLAALFAETRKPVAETTQQTIPLEGQCR
jgi:hypothetical protein